MKFVSERPFADSEIAKASRQCRTVLLTHIKALVPT